MMNTKQVRSVVHGMFHRKPKDLPLAEIAKPQISEGTLTNPPDSAQFVHKGVLVDLSVFVHVDDLNNPETVGEAKAQAFQIIRDSLSGLPNVTISGAQMYL